MFLVRACLSQLGQRKRNTFRRGPGDTLIIFAAAEKVKHVPKF